MQVLFQAPSFPWEQKLVAFPLADVSCFVAWIVFGIFRLFLWRICHHGDGKTGKYIFITQWVPFNYYYNKLKRKKEIQRHNTSTEKAKVLDTSAVTS